METFNSRNVKVSRLDNCVDRISVSLESRPESVLL